KNLFEGTCLNHNCVFPSISIKVHLKKSVRTKVLFVNLKIDFPEYVLGIYKCLNVFLNAKSMQKILYFSTFLSLTKIKKR
ncbi:TPA: hypothetical protein ACIECC_002416, partial [Enterococcus faecium]